MLVCQRNEESLLRTNTEFEATFCSLSFAYSIVSDYAYSKLRYVDVVINIYPFTWHFSSNSSNTEKRFYNKTLTKFGMFGNAVKRCLECLLYLFNRGKNERKIGELKS